MTDREYKVRRILWRILIFLQIVFIGAAINMCYQVHDKIKQLENDRIQINR